MQTRPLKKSYRVTLNDKYMSYSNFSLKGQPEQPKPQEKKMKRNDEEKKRDPKSQVRLTNKVRLTL